MVPCKWVKPDPMPTLENIREFLMKHEGDVHDGRPFLVHYVPEEDRVYTSCADECRCEADYSVEEFVAKGFDDLELLVELTADDVSDAKTKGE